MCMVWTLYVSKKSIPLKRKLEKKTPLVAGSLERAELCGVRLLDMVTKILGTGGIQVNCRGSRFVR